MKCLYGKCRIVLIYLFTSFLLYGCGSLQIFSLMGIKDEVDSNLPIVKTFRALPDVTSVGFEWKTPEDTTQIDGYIIYRENKKKKFEKIAFVKNAFSTHYYDDKLQPQTEYVYAIASVGKDSKVSRKSESLKVKTSFIDPVTFVYASQDYAHKIKIFWSPSPNPIVKNYIIERQEKGGKFVAVGSTTNRMLVEFFDRNIENGTIHSYRIIAQSYEGAKSIPSQVVVGKTRAVPPIIQGVTATNDKARAIWIEWGASESQDVVGYNVWVSSSPSDAYKKLAFVTRESYVDKIDSHGTIRYYKITAVDKYKLESEFQDSGIAGQTLPPPLAPNLTESIIENGSALIAWDKTKDTRVTSYIVYRKGSDGMLNKFSQITNTNWTDSSIKEGVSYTYYVVGVDKHGIESAPSRQVTLLLQPQPTAVDIATPSAIQQESTQAPKDSKE